MNFKSRLKLMLSIIAVFVLIGVLSTYLNYSLSRKASINASISTKSIQVGSNFSGTITSILVSEGQIVTSGETLLTIQSPDIREAIENKTLSDNNSYKIMNSETVAILAVEAASVDEILFANGSYITSNNTIMNLNELSDPFIKATFTLLPPDYAKVSDSSVIRITLPDNSNTEAIVTDISLQKNQTDGNESIETVITATPTVNASNLSKFPIDTPVKATLILDGKTGYDVLRDSISKLFKPGQ